MKNSGLPSWFAVLVVSFISFFYVQCRKYPAIEDKLAMMKSRPVMMKTEDFKVLFEPKGWYERHKHRQSPSFVLYVDSAHCSSCKLSNMPYWEDYRRIVQSRYPNVDFIVIYEPSSSEKFNMDDYVDTACFHMPVFVDSGHQFRRNNKQIPNEDIYHDFLLDEKGNILVIGNPMLNAGIEKLFFQMLDSIQRNS